MKYYHLLFLSILFLQSCSSDADNYAIKGIDVSHYQGQIGWQMVGLQNLDFVWMKATEGLNYKDSLFLRNWEQCHDFTDLKCGAYHFFRPRVSAKWQAQNFINQVELQAGDLPPVLDVEDLDGVSMSQLINYMSVWLQLIEEHYQVRPIIYTYSDLYNRHLRAAFPDYIFWLARYNRHAPQLDSQAVFWQYSQTGSTIGIVGDVDQNIFTGSLDDLERLCLP